MPKAWKPQLQGNSEPGSGHMEGEWPRALWTEVCPFHMEHFLPEGSHCCLREPEMLIKHLAIIQSDTTILSREVQNNYLLLSGFIEITCEDGKPLTKAGTPRVNVCFPSMEQVSTHCPEQRPCFWRIILMSESCKPGAQWRGFKNTDFFFFLGKPWSCHFNEATGRSRHCPWMLPSSHTFSVLSLGSWSLPRPDSLLATTTTSVRQPRWCGVPRAVPFLIPETHAFFHWLGRSIWDVKTTLYFTV